MFLSSERAAWGEGGAARFFSRPLTIMLEFNKKVRTSYISKVETEGETLNVFFVRCPT